MNVLLDTQSHCSLLWGTAHPLALLTRAGELGYTHLAITDMAALYSLPLLVRKASDLPCQPIFGASLPHASLRERTVILIESAAGYANLCRILSRYHSHMNGHKSQVTSRTSTVARPRSLLTGQLQNTHDMTCDLGPATCNQIYDLRHVIKDDIGGLIFLSTCRDTLTHLQTCGASAYYRVGQTLRAPPAWVAALRLICAFAPNVCMLGPDEHETHQLLRAIALGTTFTAVRPDAMAPASAYLRPPAVYEDQFAIFSEAMQTSQTLAKRIGFRPTPQAIFPPAPQAHATAIDTLRQRAYAGAEKRFGELSESVINRLEYELSLIEAKGFAEYFLVVEDIVSASPRTCGRGSGAASLVNYCLGVTNVDPLRYHLMFERFLNPGREDPPDIDVDFAWDERDGVLDYALERYGRTRAAMVCNHLTFQPRMAVRETARAFGLTDEEITRVMRKLPELRDEFTPEPVKLRGTFAPPAPRCVRLAKPWPEIIRLAKRLLGLPRMLSLHCGGMVIVPDEIAAHVPVETSAKGYPMIQWEKDGTEDMGLVKIDLLGNRSLAVIRDAVNSVAAANGVTPEEVIQGDPANDPATQDLLAQGRSMGVFYVESPAMRLLQQKAGKGDFEHLVIHSSIIRPAANSYIEEYLARLHGKPWAPLHPRLAGVFDETYGVPVYQEDVCKLAMALAGFDAVRADQLRKCLGKRDAAARLATHKQAFYAGGRDLKVPDAILDLAWDSILSMTGYSFCKPHSASYAQVSYETAYLKAHYPAHFMAAVISNGGGYYSAQAYVSEAMRLGLRILSPCVQRSQWTFSEDHGGVRVGLMAIKGLHRKAADLILAARETGPFMQLADFCARTQLGPDDLHRLCMVGALDSLAAELNRPQILWLLRQDKALCEAADSLFARAPRVPALPPFSLRQRQEAEYAALGFLVGAHPLSLYEEHLQHLPARVVSSMLIPQCAGQQVTLIGWPITGKVVSTKRHQPMEFFSFEDLHSLYETVLFPEACKRYARMLELPQPFLVTGRVQEEWQTHTVQVERVEPVLDLQPVRSKPVRIFGYLPAG